MANKLFNRYLEKARKANITPSGSRESIDWFRRVVTRNGQITQHGKITEGLETVSRLMPGQMVTYRYDPKLKEKLDFYDRHPLIIVLERTGNGWYGLNLHYLPPIIRAEIFERLAYNDKSLLEVARKLSRNKWTRPCLKQYLMVQTETKPRLIPKELWEVAIALPFDKFENQTKRKIWSDSRKKVKNGSRR